MSCISIPLYYTLTLHIDTVSMPGITFQIGESAKVFCMVVSCGSGSKTVHASGISREGYRFVQRDRFA